MAMLALAHGAQGLLHHGLYFAAGPEREAYYLPTDAPDLWNGMKATNEMVAQLRDPLTRGAYRGCEVTGSMHAAAWDLDGRTYALAVSASPEGGLAAFRLPGSAPEALLRADSGAPALRGESGAFTDDFPPYGARIYVSE